MYLGEKQLKPTILRLVYKPETTDLWGYYKPYISNPNIKNKAEDEEDEYDKVDLADTMWVVL